MCKIKYYLLLIKIYPQFFLGISRITNVFIKFISNFMHPNVAKKNLIPELKKELKKSKLEVLTNENDFLVKNLKKAG